MTLPIKAMILAAGRGERMRPLTDDCPKPLLKVRGKALIDWHVEALGRGGVREVVINTAWLGDQISSHLGTLRIWDEREQLSFLYSAEGDDFGYALETAGGIARALPLLGEAFWVLASDVFMPGFAFSPEAVSRFLASDKLAHLWLVPNPPHNPQGDFGLSADGLALNLPFNLPFDLPLDLPADDPAPRYTYSTIGLYRRELFDSLPFGNTPGLAVALAPLLRTAMGRQQISAELYMGAWTDVGTPARLAELNQNILN